MDAPPAKTKFLWQWVTVSLAKLQKGALDLYKTEEDPRFADLNEFGQKLAEVYSNFDARGYDVVNVIPITTGGARQSWSGPSAYGGEVGLSITRGAMVIGMLRS